LKAMAQICYQQGKDEAKAEKYLISALSQDPEWGEAYLALANLYLKQGKSREAIANLKKAVSFFPQRADLHYNLGVLYEGEGRVDKAVSELKKAVEQDPKLTAAWVKIGDLHLARQDWQEAIRDYEMAISQNPELAKSLKDKLFRAHSQMALSLHEQGGLDRAEAHYLEALSLRGNEAALLYNLGNLYREKGDLEKAEEAYRSSLKADARWAKAHMGLALLAEARKDWQASLSEWRLFLEKDPQSDLARQIRERIEKISSALERAEKKAKVEPAPSSGPEGRRTHEPLPRLIQTH
jgi:tetratricopeptide (TPR) repeat protein